MNFATIYEGRVQSIIVANNKEIAEQVTGQECIPWTENNPAHIGLKYENGQFEQPELIIEKSAKEKLSLS
jgi:hypothetical protein